MADVEGIALRRGRLELPERSRSVRDRQVDHLDEVAAVDPDLRAIGLGEVRDVTGPASVAGQAERQDRADGRRSRVREADDVQQRAEVALDPVVHDDQRVAAQVDVLVLEVGEGQEATTCGESAFAMSRTVMPPQPLTYA